MAPERWRAPGGLIVGMLAAAALACAWQGVAIGLIVRERAAHVDALAAAPPAERARHRLALRECEIRLQDAAVPAAIALAAATALAWAAWRRRAGRGVPGDAPAPAPPAG